MLRRRKRTILRPGPWPFARPRVLIEHSDERVALRYVDILRRAGYSAAICRGPSGDRQPPEQCVLATGEPCLLVDGADVVVSGLGVQDRENRAVLETLRRLHSQKPLVVELSAGEIDRYGDLIDGLHLVVSPVGAEQLLAAVDDAARASAAAPAPPRASLS